MGEMCRIVRTRSRYRRVMLSESERLEVEQLVRSHIATPSREFPALRDSGLVPLELLSRGAIEHGSSRIRRCCLILLDHLGDVRHVEVFASALRSDPVPRNRRHALHALTCQKCKASEMCVDVSGYVEACAEHDPNAKVRELAQSLVPARGSVPADV